MNKFVIVVVAVGFTIVVVSAQGPGGPKIEEFKKYVEECKAESGTTNDDLKAMMDITKINEKFWCMDGCIKKKKGVMDPDNKINMDKLLEELAEMKEKYPDIYEKIISAAKQCKPQVESIDANLATPCTASKAFGECMMMPKQNFN